MADTPFNSYGLATDVEHFLVQQNTNDAFRKVLATRVAHTLGYTATQKGQVPYVASDGTIAWMTAGAENTVIYYNSSGLPVAGAVPNTWNKIGATQTVSSPVSSVVFTDIPSSGYSQYSLIGINIATALAATSDVLLIQVSTNNGSTWKATSGDYYRNTTASTYLNAFDVSGSTSTFKYSSFEARIFGLGNSARATFSSSLGSSTGISTTSITAGNATSLSTRVVAEADNAFRVIPNSGSNITQGTFILYGLKE